MNSLIEAQEQLAAASAALEEMQVTLSGMSLGCQMAILLVATQLRQAVQADSSGHHVNSAIHLVSAEMARDEAQAYIMSSAAGGTAAH